MSRGASRAVGGGLGRSAANNNDSNN
jgi:Ca2+-binding EF-hand superfamily protein